jgi:nicotinate phosphoribosyltransferase
MNTSADAPYLDCAYKLQEYDGRPRRKRSEGKATWPGRKQVYRRYDGEGVPIGDEITLDRDIASGTPLVLPVVRGGAPVDGGASLDTARRHACAELAGLPERLRALDATSPYPVSIAPTLRKLAAEIDAAG